MVGGYIFSFRKKGVTMSRAKFFLVALFGTVFSMNTMAIDFITEAQVGEKLGAQKVIEISKYSVESLLEDGSECAKSFPSRSARAYVVKKGNNAYLYLTESGLNQLSECKKL